MRVWWEQKKILRDENDEQQGSSGSGAAGAGDSGSSSGDDEIEQLRRRLAQSESRTAQLEEHVKRQPVQHAPPQQPPAQPGFDKKSLESEFWKDPLTMTANIARQAAAEAAQAVHVNIQQSQGDLLAIQAKEVARRSDPEVFDALELHINAKLQDVPAAYKNNPTVWVNAFNVVKGEHIDKVIEIKGKGAQMQQQQRASSDGPARPSAKAAPAPKKAELTQEQKDVARKMRLTEDQYRNGLAMYEDQSLMWKGVVTFDSHNEKREVENAK